MCKVFGIRIVIWKGEIEVGVERDDLAAELFQNLRREGPGGAIAAGRDDLELARDFRPVGEIGDVAGREILDETIGAALRVAEFSLRARSRAGGPSRPGQR